jgi:hypothetical protein
MHESEFARFSQRSTITVRFETGETLVLFTSIPVQVLDLAPYLHKSISRVAAITLNMLGNTIEHDIDKATRMNGYAYRQRVSEILESISSAMYDHAEKRGDSDARVVRDHN